MCPTCIVDGQYIRAGGTSMAAPMVSGTVALLLQLNPGLTPNQIKGLLTSSDRALSEGVAEISSVRRTSRSPRHPAGRPTRDSTPNTLIDPATHDIDSTRSSWSSQNDETDAVDPSRSSWSRSSWSTSCSS